MILRFGPHPPIKNSGYAFVPRKCFFLTLITFDQKTIIPNPIWIALVLKIAEILAAQAAGHSIKNNCSASTITSKIVAPQVPTSGLMYGKKLNLKNFLGWAPYNTVHLIVQKKTVTALASVWHKFAWSTDHQCIPWSTNDTLAFKFLGIFFMEDFKTILNIILIPSSSFAFNTCIFTHTLAKI